MSIHWSHPFQPADDDRQPLRRFRGRLASPVSIWTAEHDGERTGLTVSSLLVSDGEPGFIVGVIDPLADLVDVARRSGRVVVNLLDWPDRQLADAFGYVAPAPGGPFTLGAWTASAAGPVLDTASAWASGVWPPFEEEERLGWGLLIRVRVAEIGVPDPSAGTRAEPLVHRRGRYFTF